MEGNAVVAEEKQPAGTVKRELNFRDRNLLVGACREYCQKDGKNDHKSQAKLDRVTKLIALDETIEYFEMMSDWLEDERFKWERQRNDWLAWKGYDAGSITLEDLKKAAPSVNPQTPPQKPPRRQKDLTPEENRGKARAFYFPSRIDAWVQECLKAATWNPIMAEYVTELCEKFGIKDDE